MSQPTVEPDVPEDVPEEGELVDTTGLEEVSEDDNPPEGEMEEGEEGEDATQLVDLAKISRRDVLIRGKSWIDERVMYSQKLYHRNKYGRYRQDCSGYVSMCWRLPRSYTTATIMQVARRIDRNQLRPGDALWRRSGASGHIALFVGWADAGKTTPVVYEEYKTGRPCERRKWSRKHASSFTPIRYNNIA